MTTRLGLQKVCDIHDFFHPEIDRILRQELKSVPFGSRRAWEFAMIFRALQSKGKLHAEADGLAMGAGTERLIYAIAPHVRRTVVTDLYQMSGGWAGVRTPDPQSLVMKRAPWPIDAARIEALTMDMRELKFPDRSFDFCWSTGAFEHIGNDEDFARHFAEVHRVLRPGGVYAFTTAVVFGRESLRIPHNYYFHPEHLVHLVHASPLHAEPRFDCRVTDHLFNRPHPERFEDYGFSAGHQLSKPVISARRGALLTANVMVLTRDDARPKQRPVVVGFEASCRKLGRYLEVLTRHLWQDYQLLRLERQAERLVAQPQYFGAGTVALDLMVGPGLPRGLRVTVKSRPVEKLRSWRLDHEAQVSADASDQVMLQTTAGRIYRYGIEDASGLPPERLVLRARRQP